MWIKTVVGLSAAALLAACGSSTTTGTSGPTSSAGAPSSQAGASGCGSAGQPGVLHVFCDGTATASVTIGGTTKTLTGGTCEEQAGMFTINVGTAIDDTNWPAGTPKPDYLGLIYDGTGQPTVFSARLDGTLAAAVTTGRTGSLGADKKSATIAGKTYKGVPISASVTC